MTTISSESQLDERINQILYYGLAVDDFIDGQNNCLHLSVVNDYKKCVIRLLSAGADPLCENGAGQTALDLALESGNQILYHSLIRRLVLCEERPIFQKTSAIMDLIPFNSLSLYEDYLDWSNADRFQKNQVRDGKTSVSFCITMNLGVTSVFKTRGDTVTRKAVCLNRPKNGSRFCSY